MLSNTLRAPLARALVSCAAPRLTVWRGATLPLIRDRPVPRWLPEPPPHRASRAIEHLIPSRTPTSPFSRPPTRGYDDEFSSSRPRSWSAPGRVQGRPFRATIWRTISSPRTWRIAAPRSWQADVTDPPRASAPISASSGGPALRARAGARSTSSPARRRPRPGAWLATARLSTTRPLATGPLRPRSRSAALPRPRRLPSDGAASSPTKCPYRTSSAWATAPASPRCRRRGSR